MIYRNTKTGVTIDSPCSISGGNWVEEKPVKEVTEERETPKKRK